MNIERYEIYTLSDDREKEIWKNCLFVFDTSALLDFYFYPETTRTVIFNDIFTKIEGRLWLPAHVQFEYLKNRQSTIRKPIHEKYKPLQEIIVKPIIESATVIKKRLEELKQKTKNIDKHPHLDQAPMEKFEKVLHSYLIGLEEFDKQIKAEIENRKTQIMQLDQKDTVLEAFNKFFDVGRESSFSEIKEIIKEGKYRYEFDIPPGYQDLKIEKKEGIQIFGDLIIWKQLLEHAKEKQKDIIFICNDFKSDWCFLDEAATEKRIKSPREELIKEFFDYTGKSFWMYSQAQFLYSANKLLDSGIAEDRIKFIAKITTNKVYSNDLIFCCNNCMETCSIDSDQLDLDYDCVGGGERSMGMENQYVAETSFNCPVCDSQIDATFEIWEYPVGVINYTSIELDGAKVIRECNQHIDLNDEPDWYGEDDN